jgi:tetratricopeptide (TPR) repeat protein
VSVVIATTVCNTYIELGTNAYEQGLTDVADRMLNAALEEAQRLSSPENPPCAVFNKLAHLYYRQKNFDKAEAVYEQALALYERTFEPNDPNLIGIMINLAELYFSRRKYSLAEPLYERAVQANPDSTNSAIEKCVLKLAWLYCNSQRMEEAEKLYKRARAIRESKKHTVADSSTCE